jgi:hypothetical protein
MANFYRLDFGYCHFISPLFLKLLSKYIKR